MRKYRLLLLISILMCALVLVADAHSQEHSKYRLRDSDIHRDIYTRRPKKILQTHNLFIEYMSDSEVTITVMQLESLGWYYITAYCPSECGWNGFNYPTGWTTASGEICHRADWEHRYSEPTTCAISRSVHSFGEYFYIEEFDRVFISEDTGPGVQGKHLDLFYEDYDSVLSFPTGYYEVFSVEYEEVEVRLDR
jgi:3D (Asp-Asp-Asp) domain-containing protein